MNADEDAAVCLTPCDLTKFSHFVASRQGLYAVGKAGHAQIAQGSYFGLTWRRDALYAFQHLDAAHADTDKGRIVRFALSKTHDEIRDARVVARGLDNGCHQIDFIGNELYVVDTYRQCLRVFGDDWRLARSVSPLPAVERLRRDGSYAHMNAITSRYGRLLILLHGDGTGPSEVIALSTDMKIEERFFLAGNGCHNLVVLEDGDLLSCSSRDGGLVTRSGRAIPVLPGLMTRGLSVTAECVVVGSSLFGPRQIRPNLPGAVSFMSRDYKMLARIMLPASPTDIRAIDGRDISLSERVLA